MGSVSRRFSLFLVVIRRILSFLVISRYFSSFVSKRDYFHLDVAVFFDTITGI